MKKLLLLTVLLVGCTKAKADGSYTVTCYSGGLTIYSNDTEGSVSSGNGIGWFFYEAGTGKAVKVSGTCVFKEK